MRNQSEILVDAVIAENTVLKSRILVLRKTLANIVEMWEDDHEDTIQFARLMESARETLSATGAS